MYAPQYITYMLRHDCLSAAYNLYAHDISMPWGTHGTHRARIWAQHGAWAGPRFDRSSPGPGPGPRANVPQGFHAPGIYEQHCAATPQVEVLVPCALLMVHSPKPVT